MDLIYDGDYEEIEENKNENEDNKQDKNKARISIINDKVSDLYEKLVEIQEKLENDIANLSPIKRLLLQTKLSIIETELNRQLAKLELIDAQEIYKDKKEERYIKHNEELELEQQEYDEILDRKYQLERQIERISKQVKYREKEYEEINNAGSNGKKIKSPIQAKKDTNKDIYKFSVDKSKSDIVKPEILQELEQKQQELEEIKQEQETKKNSIIEFKKEFEKQENDYDKQVSEVLAEYKPTLWRTIKFAAFKIKQNFREWRDNSKLEKQQIKEAKIKAREDIRNQNRKRNIKLLKQRIKLIKEWLKI